MEQNGNGTQWQNDAIPKYNSTIFRRHSLRIANHEIKRVYYNETNGAALLLQMHGSVWPKVLPYCFANLCIMLVILWLQKRFNIDVTSAPTALKLTSVLVSFLIVSRTSAVLGRYYQTGQILFSMNKSCRELFNYAALLTRHDRSEKAQQWRFDVAYRIIILLRATMAALEFRSSKVNSWHVLPDEWANEVMNGPDVEPKTGFEDFKLRWAHGKRTLNDENLRLPIVLSYYLREKIVDQRTCIAPKMSIPEELALMGFVTAFMSDYHHLRSFVSTPFPFPLVQMARTFLFFWVFALPFALCHDRSGNVQVGIMIFIATFGYIGLEYVSMELDDPFGEDPNDFDNLSYAQMVFEDIYITLSKADGVETARRLRSEVKLVASRLAANPLSAYGSTTEN